jgi:hypothetical protein
MMMMMRKIVELGVFSIWVEVVVDEKVLSKKVEVLEGLVVFAKPTWKIFLPLLLRLLLLLLLWLAVYSEFFIIVLFFPPTFSPSLLLPLSIVPATIL